MAALRQTSRRAGPDITETKYGDPHFPSLKTKSPPRRIASDPDVYQHFSLVFLKPANVNYATPALELLKNSSKFNSVQLVQHITHRHRDDTWPYGTCQVQIASGSKGPLLLVAAASKPSAQRGEWFTREAWRNVLISVVIPTVDRRELLVRAVQTVCQQRLGSASAEIIVIDNSLNGRQHQIVESAVQPSDSRMEVRCVHEPKRGLVFARNRGVAEAKGDFVVFLDDDECPIASDWLANLVNAAIQSGADAAFGPVVPEFDVKPARFSAFVTSLFSRDTGRPDHADITDLRAELGTGNSCFRRHTCFSSHCEPFNPEFNSSGGEDTDFLLQLRRGGKRFVWAVTAAVYEFVPRERLNPTYLSNFRFRQGQHRAYHQISSHPRRYDALAFWMAVGVLQTVYHFAAKWFAILRGKKERADQHGIQIWGGLGKILWQAKYRRSHYGPQENI